MYRSVTILYIKCNLRYGSGYYYICYVHSFLSSLTHSLIHSLHSFIHRSHKFWTRCVSPWSGYCMYIHVCIQTWKSKGHSGLTMTVVYMNDCICSETFSGKRYISSTLSDIASVWPFFNTSTWSLTETTLQSNFRSGVIRYIWRDGEPKQYWMRWDLCWTHNLKTTWLSIEDKKGIKFVLQQVPFSNLECMKLRLW
jgi:hypothetical protein